MENKDWKPEAGQTAWYFALSKMEVLREGRVTSQSKVNENFYRINHEHEWHCKLLFPTPEAALASIKVYDLAGNAVELPAADTDFGPSAGRYLSEFEARFYDFCRKDKNMVEEFAMSLIDQPETTPTDKRDGGYTN